MKRNPWLALPTKPPFVLPDDWEIIEKFNRKNTKKNLTLQTEMLPEPFVGSLDAPLVILLQNPGDGSSKKDRALHRQADFQRRVRACHRQEVVPYPHYFVDPKEKGPGGEWTKKWVLKELIADFGHSTVALGVVFLELVPYHSKNFAHSGLDLPSQDFTLQALQRAIRREATIIIAMGNGDGWIKAVPALDNYRLLFRTSSLMGGPGACISRNNCRFASIKYGEKADPKKGRPSGYEAAQAALERVAKKQKS
jgi:hypothetical protein